MAAVRKRMRAILPPFTGGTTQQPRSNVLRPYTPQSNLDATQPYAPAPRRPPLSLAGSRHRPRAPRRRQPTSGSMRRNPCASNHA
eukprot:8369276-Heterocapsa_arctica.AAC.1